MKKTVYIYDLFRKRENFFCKLFIKNRVNRLLLLDIEWDSLTIDVQAIFSVDPLHLYIQKMTPMMNISIEILRYILLPLPKFGLAMLNTLHIQSHEDDVFHNHFFPCFLECSGISLQFK